MNLSEMKIGEIYDELEDCKNIIDLAKKRKKDAESEVLKRYEERIRGSNKIYNGTGTANIEDAGFNIKVTIPKSVSWDPDRLSELYERIQSYGDDPAEYMDVAYKVPENKYKNWPKMIQDQFIDARTMKPGTPKIKKERIEDE